MINPKTSIILPFYNAELTIQRAIDSIINQNYSDFELILIDNNSTDQSYSIAKSYKDPRIILVQEQKQGVSYATNKGLAISKGQYIARMDADDFSFPNRLELQVNHLDNNPNIDISSSLVNYIPNPDTNNAFNNFVEWSNSIHTVNDIHKNRFIEFPVVNPSMMIRKSVFDHIGDYHHDDFPEDYHWFLRACEHNFKTEKINTPLLNWHDSLNRLTRQDKRYRADAFFEIKTEFIANELHRINKKEVWIWGAGRLGFKRSQLLTKYKIKITGYIDIKKKNLTDHKCIPYQLTSLDEQPMIVSYVSNRNVREKIRTYLDKKGYTESINYIIAG